MLGTYTSFKLYNNKKFNFFKLFFNKDDAFRLTIDKLFPSPNGEIEKSSPFEVDNANNSENLWYRFNIYY